MGRGWKKSRDMILSRPHSPRLRPTGLGESAGGCNSWERRDHFPLGPRGNPGNETLPEAIPTGGCSTRQGKVRSSASMQRVPVTTQKSQGSDIPARRCLGGRVLRCIITAAFIPAALPRSSHGSAGFVLAQVVSSTVPAKAGKASKGLHPSISPVPSSSTGLTKSLHLPPEHLPGTDSGSVI